MIKKVLILVSLFTLISGVSFGEVVTTFEEVMKPSQIVIDEDQIYVIENTTIYIYSLKDYKFKKKFGKKGEGPGEFNFFVSIFPYKKQLLINSFGKLSYYKRDGEMIKEKKTKSSMVAPSLAFFPLEKGFVGRGTSFEDKKVFQTINLFDSDLNKTKELKRMLVATRGGWKNRGTTKIFCISNP